MRDTTKIFHTNSASALKSYGKNILGDSVSPPILLVDDESDLLESYELALNSHGMTNVIAISDSTQVENILQTRSVELLVLDLMIPQRSGEDILIWARDRYPQLPVIVVTGNNDAETAVRCMKMGAADYLIKPVDRTRYISSIRKVIETRSLQRKSLTRIATDENYFSDIKFDESRYSNESLKGSKGFGRKAATVVLSDICGYAAMFQHLEPEDVYKIVSTIKLSAVSIVEALGGIVNQFVGDEVVSIFGIPEASYNSAIRSVAAALEIHSMVRDTVAGYSDRFPIAMDMHSGIGTGELVINRGSRLCGQFDISGNPINIAARLRDLASSSEIIVDQHTAHMIEGCFETINMKGVNLKNIQEIVSPSVILTRW